jgi:protein SCO1/2
MRQELISIADALKDKDDFMIISHTIDMSHDTVEVLYSYWETTEVPYSKWQFLRATESNTKAQAKQFMTNFRPNEDGTDFYHSSYVALIDKKQQIRGFYNTLTPIDMERLVENIKDLVN